MTTQNIISLLPVHNNSNYYWTMSPAGFTGSHAGTWIGYTKGCADSSCVNTTRYLRLVVNLTADVQATGSGTSSDPFIIQ